VNTSAPDIGIFGNCRTGSVKKNPFFFVSNSRASLRAFGYSLFSMSW